MNHDQDRDSQQLGQDEFVFSNAVRLSGGEWLGLLLFTLALVLFGPTLWKQVEEFEPEPDYRMPYVLRSDYWHYERYAQLAAAHYDVLVIGDSVVWGQYSTRQETLSHYLNEQSGSERFANLGLPGGHPAALAGLLQYYGGAIKGKKVLLHCNPLWMSSPEQDLQEQTQQSINHPELIPQFFPHLPRYKAEVSKRLGNVFARNVSFAGWTNHLQQAYCDGKSIPAWTLDQPYEAPWHPLTKDLPPADNVPQYEPVSWTTRGIKKQPFAWVDPATSFQWLSFRRAVEILEQRQNRVFVLVGPFNKHMVSDGGRANYQQIMVAIDEWLREKDLPYARPSAMPSELYGDASHPLPSGYVMLAREILEHPFFK
jgi:hypothetical protein